MKKLFSLVSLCVFLSCNNGSNSAATTDSSNQVTDTSSTKMPADTATAPAIADTTSMTPDPGNRNKKTERKELRMEKKNINDSLKKLK